MGVAIVAMLNALPHALKHTARMQKPGRQRFVIKWRGKTKYIRVTNQLGPHARAHGITVDANYASQCATVRVQCRRAVMCLNLDAGIIAVYEGNYPGIVAENGFAIVTLAHALTQNSCSIADACLIKIVNPLRSAPMAAVSDG